MSFFSIDGDGPVPVVTVLVNGGTGSLNTVKETLNNGLPVVVVNRSGRAADILAFAVKTSRWYVLVIIIAFMSVEVCLKSKDIV